MAREIYDREAREATKQARGRKEDARLYETASRAEVLECYCLSVQALVGGMQIAGVSPHKTAPARQSQRLGPSGLIRVRSAGLNLTVITSWLERWRLATLIPPAMAGGGSDPCTGSTAKISPRKRASGISSSRPGKIGAGRGDALSFAFSSLPRFIRDESSGAPPLSNAIHALGRVKLRQASGVLFMARWPETCHPKSPSSGNTPPLPGIAQIKSRHGPVAGTRAVWPWETSPGLPARGPNFHKYSIHAARQLIPKYRRGRVGKGHRSGLPAQRARSQLAHHHHHHRPSFFVVSFGQDLPGQCSRRV